jgi:hypothetical protein
VPIASRRTDRHYELDILAPFTVPKTNDLERDMAEGFAKLVPALETGIRRGTSQWVMFQQVWPETPPLAVRVFPVGSPIESELLEKVAQALPERPLVDRKPLVKRRKDDAGVDSR